MKKILLIILAVLIGLTACTNRTPIWILPPDILYPNDKPETPPATEDIWDGTTKDTSWYNKDDSSFSLSTAAELAGLAELAKNNSFEGKTITLTKDINLDGKEWTPIGTATTPFKGTIEGGNGVKISNLKMTAEIESNNLQDNQKVAGFIGFLAGGAVKNITFTDASISVGEDVAAAVVAGFMNGGTIDRVNVNGADINGGNDSDFGTIAGKLYDAGSITNCVVTGTSITLDAGTNDWESCNIGGIVGSFSNEGQQQNKIISGNVVDLSGDVSDVFKYIGDNSSWDKGSRAIGGIIGQIGGGTQGTVSGNTLIIADVNQIADGKGGIITGYSQQFYDYEGDNKGICGEKTWTGKNAYVDGNAKVSELSGNENS